MLFPKLGGMAARAPFGAVDAVALSGLNSPVHNFGVVQALGGGETTLGSSVPDLAEAGAFSPSCSASGAGVCCGFGSSGAFSDTGFEASLETVLGTAGITGTAGKVDR